MKLDEILKPKIGKEEAVALLRKILHRLHEIAKEHKLSCTGYLCNICEEDCKYKRNLAVQGSSFVDELREALDVDVELELRQNIVVITVRNVAPNSHWNTHSLTLLSVFKIYDIPTEPKSGRDFVFLLETKRTFRAVWRKRLKFIEEVWLEDAMRAFFDRLDRGIQYIPPRRYPTVSYPDAVIVKDYELLDEVKRLLEKIASSE